jgi:GDP-L-fucose synthase
MDQNSKIYIVGHKGLVGSAIVRKLKTMGYNNLLLRTRSELDLRDQMATDELFRNEKPEYVFLAAAKVGGILANDTYRAEFIYDNLAIQTNVIHASYLHGVKRLLFLGSSCIYPRGCPQPIKEEYLLTGPLEPTNEPYAIAKIAGLKMCEAYNRQYGTQFICAMPTNLYGPNDNFDLESAHVLPALVRKFVEAKRCGDPVVTVWGTGEPLREFMYVDDAAGALVHLMNIDIESWRVLGISHINIGTGEDMTIAHLADIVRHAVEYDGDIVYDHSRPDGMPRKLLNVERMTHLGWKASINLKAGVDLLVNWYNRDHSKGSEL